MNELPIKFYESKYKVMHIGKAKWIIQYYLKLDSKRILIFLFRLIMSRVFDAPNSAKNLLLPSMLRILVKVKTLITI